MSKWQTIETAPKNSGYKYGPRFIGFADGEVMVLHWWDGNKSGWMHACNFIGDNGQAYYPTHWMPLPEPPDRF